MTGTARGRPLLDCLQTPTALHPRSDVGAVSEELYRQRLEELDRDGAYTLLVAEDAGRIVGTATLFVERKLIHGCSAAGHIEDVVVDASVRGKGVGRLLVERLIQVPPAHPSRPQAGVSWHHPCPETRCTIPHMLFTQTARDAGCYKVILDCKECNTGFYEKCGFAAKGIQMARYF